MALAAVRQAYQPTAGLWHASAITPKSMKMAAGPAAAISMDVSLFNFIDIINLLYHPASNYLV